MKKSLILFIVTAILITMAEPLYTSAMVFSDTEGTECEEAVDVLSAIGILEGKDKDSFSPGDELTRAELVTIVLRTMGMADAVNGEDVFEDVKSEHWAYKNIFTAYKLGLIKGTSETEFMPDEAVTYAQAVKILVCALGYEAWAETLGGYPSGYLSKASQLGLLKGINKNDNADVINRSQMAVMVYNAINTDVCVRSTYGENAYSYTTLENVTLISQNLGIEKVEAQVTANYFARISVPQRELLSDEVAIGTTVFKTGSTNVSSMLGRNVTAYVKTRDEDTPVVLAVIGSKNGNILKIDAADVIPEETATGNLRYEKSGKEFNIKLSNAVMVLNGENKGMNWSKEELCPDSGTITLISNADSYYSVIIVESYTDYIVESVYKDNSIVYFKNMGQATTQMVIDPDSKDKKVKFTDTYGDDVTLDELGKGDVLSISEGKDVLKIILSYTKVTGTVTEVSGDEYVINGTTYKIANSLKKASASIEKPVINMTAKYCIDFTGNIAAVLDSRDTDCLYAWLAGGAKTKGLSGVPQLKLFTQSGEMKIFDLAEKVTFVSSQGFEKVIPRNDLLNLADLVEDGNVVNQLIRYKLSGEGIINRIETAQDYRDNPDDESRLNCFSNEMYLNKDQKLVTSAGAGEYVRWIDGCYSSFCSKFIITSSTLTFIINSDESECNVSKGKTKYNYTNQGFKCYSVYDVKKDGTVTVAVWNNKKADEELGTGGADKKVTYLYDTVSIAMVKYTAVALNEDGEKNTVVKAVSGSGAETDLKIDNDFCIGYGFVSCNPSVETAKSYTDSEGNSCGLKLNSSGKLRDLPNSYINVKDLNPGDIIFYQTNFEGEVSFMNVIYRADNPGLTEIGMNPSGNIIRTDITTETDFYTGLAFSGSGIVEEVFDNVIACKTYKSDAIGQIYPKGSPNYKEYKRLYSCPYSSVLLFDSKKETVRLIQKKEIQAGDNLCILIGVVTPRYDVYFVAVFR